MKTNLTILLIAGFFIQKVFSQSPSADFLFSSSCAEHIVSFEDLSQGTMLNYRWDFGDGSPYSTKANPVHKYQFNGTYTVVLKVDNVFGVDSIIKSVTINRSIPLNISGCSCEDKSYVPNYSFEDRSCCPSNPAQMSCADTWMQASGATTDYLNLCGLTNRSGVSAPVTPIPDGSGYVGVWNGVHNFLFDNNYKEYAGACLTNKLKAGETYKLSFYVGYGAGNTAFEIGVFGSQNCSDLPFGIGMASGCPMSYSGWNQLAVTNVSTAWGSWQLVNLTITPSVDIATLVLGPSCSPALPTPSSVPGNYYYFDAIDIKRDVKISITKTGGFCEDLTFNSSILAGDTTGHYMWFKNNIELVGETSSSLNVADKNYGAGYYKCMYIVGDFCVVDSLEIYDPVFPKADFSFNEVCLHDTTDFMPNLNIWTGDIVHWKWVFGDEGGSDIEKPSFVFSKGGKHLVKLMVQSNEGCKDTIEKEVIVHSLPKASFSFINDSVDFYTEEVCAINLSSNATNFIWKYNNLQINTWDACIDLMGKSPGSHQLCLEVTNEFNCFHDTCGEFYVKEVPLLYIPNTFSPNGDGFNDNFEIDLSSLEITNFSVIIYDRWGKEIKRLNQSNLFWDGHGKNGDLLPIGTYVWDLSLQANNSDGIPYNINKKGHVNIVR